MAKAGNAPERYAAGSSTNFRRSRRAGAKNCGGRITRFVSNRNDKPSQLVELVSQLTPGQASEFPSARISPAKGALADLNRPEQAISIADHQFDAGAGLGNIPRLQGYVHRVARLYPFRLS